MYSLSWPTAEASTPAADVRDAGELQEALEGAVLAVRAVQHGEDDVDLAERLGHRSGLAVDDFAVAGSTGSTTPPSLDSASSSTSGVLRSVIAMRSGSSAVSAQRPSRVMPIGRTSYLRPVDGPQYGAGGDHGDPVLGAATAEHDGHARLAGRLLRALGEVLGAHIALRVPAGRGRSQRAPRGERAEAALSVARAWRCATSAP